MRQSSPNTRPEVLRRHGCHLNDITSPRHAVAQLNDNYGDWSKSKLIYSTENEKMLLGLSAFNFGCYSYESACVVAGAEQLHN